MTKLFSKYLLSGIAFMAPGFDPDTFMQQTVDAPLETEFKICPAGEYPSMIDDFDSSAFEQIDFEYKKGARAGEPGTMTKFNCPFVINDDRAKQELGRDKVIVYATLLLDIDENGGIATGQNKNVKLGQIREAVGQNQAGSWSVAQLRGAGPLMVKVEHIEFQRKDGTKGKRAEVTRYVAIRS
jgi:hypothetical protein